MQDAIAWRWSEDPEQKRWMDWKTDWTHHDKAKAMGCPVEYAVAQSALDEPGKVYHAMLRGEIPKLTWRQMVHLSGPVPNTADEALAEITRLRGEVKSGEADIDRYVSINAELATELEKSRRVLEEARRVSRELHGADRCTKCGYLFLESEHIGCIRAASECTEQERQLRRDMLDIADTLQKAVAPLRDDSHLCRFPTCFATIDDCLDRLKEGGE